VIPVPLTTCPECGVSLEGLSPKKHAVRHWGPVAPDKERFPEAHRRYTLLTGGD